MHADLALALELADLADRIALRRFRAADLVVETKPDLTPVSEADREAEQAIRRRLEQDRPADAVMGEEYGLAGEGERRWILDPIDGTKNYVRGVPVYASLIALEQAGEIVVGVVSAPSLGRRWWAARGDGAFADGKPIRVSAVRDLTDAHYCYVRDERDDGRNAQLDALRDRCWRTRGFGDFWQHVLVAEGAVDIAVDPEVSLWDVAALQVIVEEAGGRITDLSGRRDPNGGSALSTNGALHDAVLKLLQ